MSEAPIEPVGDLAIVLHSHMPYVEGYGTYPFGEEWLFDAFIRSHLPVLEVARDCTVTVTPVLADQLEAEGVAERLERFTAENRLGAAELDLVDVDEIHGPAVEAEIARYSRALETIRGSDDPLDAFRLAARERNVELIGSSATHAVLPLLATRAGKRLQIDAGMRSHRRRFGASSRGFWLPECAYDPGLEPLLGEAGIEWFVTDQTPYERDGEALSPVASAGQTAFTIDWPTVDRVWSWQGYPSFPGYADFHRTSGRGMRIFSIEGGAYDPAAAAEQAVAQADEFCTAVAARLAVHRERTGTPGLVTFAADTELFGHWWSEGPRWLEAVLARAPEVGIRLTSLGDARDHHPGREVTLARASWGENKDLSTWDCADVADIAWAARRLEVRLVAELGRGRIDDQAALRAARELLAVQASDWAFLDGKRQAGEYAFDRAARHAEDLVSVLAGDRRSAELRNLAPDLRLAPLKSPVP